jgi:hypothetical protein
MLKFALLEETWHHLPVAKNDSVLVIILISLDGIVNDKRRAEAINILSLESPSEFVSIETFHGEKDAPCRGRAPNRSRAVRKQGSHK